MAIRELARRALKDLAEIRGLTRDQPPPPPKPNLTFRDVLHLLPTSVMVQIDAAFEQVQAQRQATLLPPKEVLEAAVRDEASRPVEDCELLGVTSGRAMALTHGLSPAAAGIDGHWSKRRLGARGRPARSSA